MYPRLEIDIEKLRHNAKVILQSCHERNIKVSFVTKSFCARKEIVEAVYNEGIDHIADSRIQNLKKLQNINLPKILIRIPMISELEEVINYCDISFNSELETIKKLNELCESKNIIHNIVLMFDLGDLREGYFYEEDLFNSIKEIVKLKNIKIIGIATNLTCYGAIIPSKENTGRLVSIAQKIEGKFGINLEIVSGGNSSSIHLMTSNNMPEGINNLRIGESILLGRETAYGKNINGTYQDVFKLICQIVECKEKPSVPIGEIGVDAFRNKPVYEDKGILKRAIIAIGKQDINIDSLIPIDTDIEILGASSDHMILDVSNTKCDYKLGDNVDFLLTYGGIMSSSTSEYVSKKIIV
ncbi:MULTISPECIES: ornithine racemase Orr [unclassified Clostridioides]|uniref:ornithine racemase Orr n=1 Tax=unclassified Clostridioides TaxID=2635829 RepID=UPI001D0C8250|nr:alanine/ornithine racemase family PLP-dependent enzyme [Clostridioides sp. ES-S-0049-03]MCC0654293.1 alanine/ornithine racemase family PLP-dependent enzyme [Clostridioides sp. ES-S-0001-03]MCC0657884.1 alanine/ornithine racemase family PLP-dependent enzyme [Clostridioides sp. ES-S-0123-01]MCC0674140.1 alanine/ornithine racemase family PLP-dependent enzyme [Clostridioides sp. ES-S-0145-01]MCC0677140.1 alanine/ornithine racemase family PLP-dependent enzyme [Clostridioides sp. ES-W-0018-02]MCC